MKNTRKDNLLTEAIKVLYDRKSEKALEYGDFETSMASAASIASETLGKTITIKDMFVIMMSLKMARLRYSDKSDTYLDLIAYSAQLHNIQNKDNGE